MWVSLRQRGTRSCRWSSCLLSRPAPVQREHVRALTSVSCPAAFASPFQNIATTASHRRNNSTRTIDVAAEGHRVKVHLKGTFDDASIFDDTTDDQPLTLVLGSGAALPGLDEAVRGMRVGEEKEFRLEDAFGKKDDPARQSESPRDQMPPDCKVGAELRTADGNVCKVIELTDEIARLDFCHPLAGKAVNLWVKLISCSEVQIMTKQTWETLSPGDGKTFPKEGDKLTVHYTGMLASTGAVFDSSRTRDQPFEFKVGVGQVIRGWDDGVIQMSLGERCELNIPYAAAYGVRGSEPTIPSSADLIFDVELLKIN